MDSYQAVTTQFKQTFLNMNHSEWKLRKAKVEQYFDQAKPPKDWWPLLLHHLRQLWLWLTGKQAASDNEANVWIDEARKDVEMTAKLRLDLDQSKQRTRYPFVVESPAEQAKWYQGKDNRVRASRMEFTQVFLMNYFIACYRATYDLAEQAIIHDETEEFPYEEITGFGTQMSSTGSITIEDEEDVRGKVQRRQFIVFTRSGASLRVPFLVARLVRGKEPLHINDEGSQTIVALRKQLSDYKRPQWERNSGNIL